jgi:hypothetical protein
MVKTFNQVSAHRRGGDYHLMMARELVQPDADGYLPNGWVNPYPHNDFEHACWLQCCEPDAYSQPLVWYCESLNCNTTNGRRLSAGAQTPKGDDRAVSVRHYELMILGLLKADDTGVQCKCLALKSIPLADGTPASKADFDAAWDAVRDRLAKVTVANQ